mgnify:CR=1 FL=1
MNAYIQQEKYKNKNIYMLFTWCGELDLRLVVFVFKYGWKNSQDDLDLLKKPLF